jgi:hypothetical protein
MEPAFTHYRVENCLEGLQVLHCLPRKAVDFARHKRCGVSTVLGRAWAVATCTDWIADTIFPDHQIFDPHIVAPGNIEVVLIDQARTLAHAQLLQAHIGRRSSQIR